MQPLIVAQTGLSFDESMLQRILFVSWILLVSMEGGRIDHLGCALTHLSSCNTVAIVKVAHGHNVMAHRCVPSSC